MDNNNLIMQKKVCKKNIKKMGEFGASGVDGDVDR
jgi:hypothetical protein